MKSHLIKRAIVATAILFTTYSSVVSAEGGAFAKENFSNTITLTTDYVFRGVSFTSEDPAIQGSFDWGYNGWYAGVWGSNIELPNSSLELDYYAGYANSTAGGFDYDFTLIYYNFPSAEDRNSFGGLEPDQWEVWANFGYGFEGAVSPYLGLFLAYSPDFTLEDGDGFYIKGSLALSFANDWGLDFAVGYQDVEGDDATGSSGAFCDPVTDILCDGYSYTHWEIGLTKALGGFGLDLRYHDTDEDGDHKDFLGTDKLQEDRVVFSISRSF